MDPGGVGVSGGFRCEVKTLSKGAEQSAAAHSYDVRDIRAPADAADAVPAGERTGGDGMSKNVNLVNLTEVQVRKQLDSMRIVEVFEIGIRDGRAGRMQNIEMSAGDVIANIPRLRRENAKGADVYIRPVPREQHPYVLLDDVGVGTIQRMKQDGIEPTIEVETSPSNYQVWIRLPESLSRPDRKAVERLLVGRYGADRNSADGGHYGRLAGFTNRKPGHIQDDGRSPFVKLAAIRPSAMLSVSVWSGLKEAAEQLQPYEIAVEAKAQPLPLAFATRMPGGAMSFDVAEASAKRQYSAACVRWGYEFDSSRADYFIARNLLQRGASQDVVRKAIAFASPGLELRKAGHVDDYLSRTIENACKSIS